MSGHQYVRMRDARRAAANEAARLAAEAREKARRAALRRAAEAAAAARLAAARSACDEEASRLSQVLQQLQGLGLKFDPLVGAVAALEVLRPGTDVGALRERQAELGRVAKVSAVCVAAAGGLAEPRQRAALVAELAAATSVEELERRAIAWRGAAESTGDAVRLAIRAREAGETLARHAAIGLHLTKEQQRLCGVLERYRAAPGPETRDDASRALSRLDVMLLERRLRDRQEHLVRVSARLLEERRGQLVEWRSTLPADLEALSDLISRNEWRRVADIVAEVEACGFERARVRLMEFLAAGASAGLHAGPVVFDAERKTFTSSLRDARGHFADVNHPASLWDHEDLDELSVAGPSSFTQGQCIRAGIGLTVETLRSQGVPVEVYDERRAPVLTGSSESNPTSPERRSAAETDGARAGWLES